ncbi:unnamed protein product [Caenorhabditis nigoni]
MESKVQILSPSLRNLHRQFFKTLVLQVLTPTVTLFGPVIVLTCLPLFDIKLDLPLGIVASLLAFYPAVDAIFVMYVVQDYRKAMKNVFNGFIKCLHIGINSADAQQTPTETVGSPSVLN